MAAELGEYLEALESMSFSFDGGATALNFAEGAALLFPSFLPPPGLP